MKTETKCQHNNVLHTDVEPICKDCDTFLASGERAYANPGWLVLTKLFSAFEDGLITEDQALDFMDSLGYTFTTGSPEQTKNPS